MTGTMICTRCHCDTHCEPPDTTRMSVEVVRALCEGWRCDDCLDEIEREDELSRQLAPDASAAASHNVAVQAVAQAVDPVVPLIYDDR